MDQTKCFVKGEATEYEGTMEGGSKKIGNVYGTVVPGEAPESDDETCESLNKVSKYNEETSHFINDDNGDDFDEYDEDSCNSASEAFMYRSSASTVTVSDADTLVSGPALKYNTILHRKLCESNLSLAQGVSDLLNRPLLNASHKLNIVNQHLLTSQVEIQDAVSAIKRTFNTFSKIENTLSSVLAMPYLPNINIYVPPKNNTS